MKYGGVIKSRRQLLYVHAHLLLHWIATTWLSGNQTSMKAELLYGKLSPSGYNDVLPTLVIQ